MKISKLIQISMIAIVLAGAASCSHMSKPTDDEVMEKINNGEQLEAADYETMLDYLEEFCDAGEMTGNSYEEGRAVGEQYPYFMPFAMMIDNAPSEITNETRYTEVKNRFRNLMNR